jgi:hypothetical protein
MNSNNLGYYKDTFEILDRFKASNSKYKNQVIFTVIILLAIFLVVFFLYILPEFKHLIQEGYQLTIFLYVILIFFILFAFHEPMHFIALLVCIKLQNSRQKHNQQKPQFGYKFPWYMFIKLAPNSSISKLQGILSYLSPFFVLTIVALSVSFLLRPLFFMLLLTAALMHIAPCCYDFVDVYRLLKCRGKNVRITHTDNKEDFETIYFRDKPSKSS